MTAKKKNAKTQRKKGEPITDKNRLTPDITKAYRFNNPLYAQQAAVVLNKFNLVRSVITCMDIGEWTYLAVELPGGDALFVADPDEMPNQ